MTVSASSEAKPGRGLWLLVLLWAATVVVALIALFQDQNTVFDEGGRVAQSFPSVADYLSELQAKVPVMPTNDQAMMIRITEAGCPCNIGSAGHWQQMQQAYPETAFVALSLKQVPKSVQALLPATPMALYVDSQGQVLYAGPFSQGAFCNSKNSLVEAYVAGDVHQPYAPLDSMGCYCSLR